MCDPHNKVVDHKDTRHKFPVESFVGKRIYCSDTPREAKDKSPALLEVSVPVFSILFWEAF